MVDFSISSVQTRDIPFEVSSSDLIWWSAQAVAWQCWIIGVFLCLSGSSAIGAAAAEKATGADARGEPAIYRFNIPEQPAEKSLNELAQQAQVPLLFDFAEVGGVTTESVVGDYTVAAALDQLLAGTTLRGRINDSGVLTVTRVSDAVVIAREPGEGTDTVTTSKTTSRSFFGRIGAALAAVVLSGGAQAADSTESAADAVIEEILVTALRREQSLQASAVSISAFSGENLENMGAKSFIDYARSVPSLSFIDFGPGQVQIIMRGVTTGSVRQDLPKVKEAVGIYIDEVPVSTARNAMDPNLFDIERIEVLRGPQGTLYGSGSLAGTVRVITNKPDAERFDFKASATIAAQDEGDETYSVNGMVNIPVVEGQSALRIVGYYNALSGFIDNVARSDENVDEVRMWGVRVAYSHQFTDRFGALAKVFYQELDTDGLPVHTGNTATSNDPRYDIGEFEQYSPAGAGVKDRFTIYNLEFDYDFEWGNLVSSTSYLDRQHEDHLDVSWLAPLFFGVDLLVPAVDAPDIESFAQEFRLTSAGDGRLNWVVGAYYNHVDKHAFEEATSPGFDDATGLPSSLFGAPPDTLVTYIVDFEEEQIAVYGEIGYGLTDRWTATVGARWFDVTQDTTSYFDGILNGGVDVFTGQAGESDVHPKFQLAYQATDDALLYAVASKGFRLGGTNDPVPQGPCGEFLAELGLSTTPPSYDSESVWNYELGAKTGWLDQRLTINASVYQIDWTEIQGTRSLGCLFTFIENGGEAQSRGVELEVVSRPTPNLELSLSSSYTKAELTEDFTVFGVADGTPLPWAPEWSGYGAVTYHFPQSGEYAYYLRADASYTGSRWNTLVQQNNPGAREMSSYTLVNVRGGVEAEKWRVELFVTNLNNERAELTYAASSLRGVESITLNRPRAIGLTVSAKL